jgi:hypothetical protein
MSHCVSRNFPRFFGIFRVFFVLEKNRLDLSLHGKINSEKKEKKPTLSVLGRTRRPDPARLSQPARPARGPSGQRPWPGRLCRRRQVFGLGVRASSAWARVAIKSECRSPARALLCRHALCPSRRRSCRTGKAPPR